MSKIIINNIENIYFTPEGAFQEPTRNALAQALVGAMFAASAPMQADACPVDDEDDTFAGGDEEGLTAKAPAQPDAPPASLRERVIEFLMKDERYKYRTFSAISQAMDVPAYALEDVLDELELDGDIEIRRRHRDGARLFGLT